MVWPGVQLIFRSDLFFIFFKHVYFFPTVNHWRALEVCVSVFGIDSNTEEEESSKPNMEENPWTSIDHRI